MHKEAQNSRSELTVDEAKKKIDGIHGEICSEKIKFTLLYDKNKSLEKFTQLIKSHN